MGARRVGAGEFGFVSSSRRLHTLEYPIGTAIPVRPRLGTRLRRNESPVRRVQLPSPAGRPAGSAKGYSRSPIPSDFVGRHLARGTETSAHVVSCLPDTRHPAL